MRRREQRREEIPLGPEEVTAAAGVRLAEGSSEQGIDVSCLCRGIDSHVNRKRREALLGTSTPLDAGSRAAPHGCWPGCVSAAESNLDPLTARIPLTVRL